MPLNIENYLPGVRDAGNPGIATNETLTVGTNATITTTTATFAQSVSFTGATGATYAGLVTGNRQNVVNVSSALGNTNATLTNALSGSLVLVNSTQGSIVTLPGTTATPGTYFEYAIVGVPGGGSAALITANANTFLLGGVTLIANTSSTFLGDGSTAVALRMNGTTTGGSSGTILNVTNINGTQWVVTGSVVASGLLATPFTTS